MTADVLIQSVHQPTGGGWLGVGFVVPTCTACCLSLREAFYHLDQNILVASGSKSYSELSHIALLTLLCRV